MNSFIPWAAVIAALSFSACSPAPVSCRRDADCPEGEACEAGFCDLEEAPPDAGVLPKPDGGMRCTPGTECRPRSGDCDVPEVCGADGFCPADAFVASGTVCRAPAGPCDLEERCSGDRAECPADELAPATTVCRSSGGLCDPSESCSGSSAQCPADSRLGAGVVCRASAGTCDVEERCDGTTLDCPADTLAAFGVSCRPATGACDVEETCSGTNPRCPPDGIRPAGESCRAAANECDVGEVCTGGAKECPVDAFQPTTLQCAAQVCMAGVTSPARYCAGSSATCLPATTVSCNGYTCDGATCRTTCSSNAECLSTHSCQAGLCAPRRPNGTACSGPTAGSECISNTCLGSYLDVDHDGFGAGPIGYFCGTSAPGGRSTTAGDCCDTDIRARPGQTVFFALPRDGCGGYDYDCDGSSTRQYSAANACNSTGSCSTEDRECDGTTGWADTSAPSCGETATYIAACRAVSACSTFSCSSCRACEATTQVRTQACR